MADQGAALPRMAEEGSHQGIPRNPRAALRWAFEHIGGSQALADWAQESNENRRDFYRMWASTMPKQGKVEVSGNVGHLHLAAFTQAKSVMRNEIADAQDVKTLPAETPYTVPIRDDSGSIQGEETPKAPLLAQDGAPGV